MPAFDTLNPTTGEIITSYEWDADSLVRARLSRAVQAQAEWQDVGFAARARCFREAARLLRVRRDEYARLMACEMGKPVTQGRGEIDKCAWGCEYFAEHAEAMLVDELVATEAKKSYITYQPLGVVFAIMPWNYPFWQIFRFAAPALMAGNVAVFKHAPNTTGCGMAVVELMRKAGFPEGVLQALVIDEAQAASVIAHPAIAAVTLTGSARAGRAVASAAGASLKKCVLELGGTDPWVILEDADLREAAKQAVQSRLVNAGQVCIAAKRLIVVDAVREEFGERVKELMAPTIVGDPLLDATEMGPLARHDLRQNLARQVSITKDQGANCVTPCVIPEGPGFYFPPTLLTNVLPGMAAFEEELFGPVVTIVPARNEAEALRLANQSEYGLGAVVFTQDLEHGEKIAREKFQAGACFVNAAVHSDPRLPFGGIKASGFGRELGAHGLKEFANVKTVWVA